MLFNKPGEQAQQKQEHSMPHQTTLAILDADHPAPYIFFFSIF
jgi:hypothetical protein